jgi:hypothetical protein
MPMANGKCKGMVAAGTSYLLHTPLPGRAGLRLAQPINLLRRPSTTFVLGAVRLAGYLRSMSPRLCPLLSRFSTHSDPVFLRSHSPVHHINKTFVYPISHSSAHSLLPLPSHHPLHNDPSPSFPLRPSLALQDSGLVSSRTSA